MPKRTSVDQLLEQVAAAALRLAEDATLYADQVPYDSNVPRELWQAARHDAGVTAAMQVADQLHQIRASLVAWDSQGFLPVCGIARQLEDPHTLANQLGHNTPDEEERQTRSDPLLSYGRMWVWSTCIGISGRAWATPQSKWRCVVCLPGCV